MYRSLQNTSIKQGYSSKKLATSSKLATGSWFPTLKKTVLPVSQPILTNITTSQVNWQFSKNELSHLKHWGSLTDQ